MTISEETRKEAKEIWNLLCAYRDSGRDKPYLLIAEALQKKQDTIQTLESQARQMAEALEQLKLELISLAHKEIPMISDKAVKLQQLACLAHAKLLAYRTQEGSPVKEKEKES